MRLFIYVLCFSVRKFSHTMLHVVYILYSNNGSEMNLKFFVAVDKRFEHICTKGKPYSGTRRESMEKEEEDQEIPGGETLLPSWR